MNYESAITRSKLKTDEQLEREKFLKIHKTDPKYLDKDGCFIDEDSIVQAYLDYEEAFHDYYYNKKSNAIKSNISMEQLQELMLNHEDLVF